MSRIRVFFAAAFAASVLAFASLACAQDVSSDPPDRVARLAYSSGDVEFAPAGENDWGSADLNRPLTTGDRLLTGDDGRAALELNGAALRIDHGSAFNFLDLNDNTAQVELSQGTLNLRVRDVGNGQTYEIDTPTVAFVASRPGAYRVDVAPDGHGAMVTVFDGAGTVYGQNGVSRPVDAGQSYRFNDSGLTDVDVAALPSPDDFDRWAESRDNRSENSVSRRYVSPDVIGYDDLDDYGAWQDTSDYGAVWYPTQVYSGWAPYRDGHWAWIEPWGWTWVDDAPWGFAPFHYGRWVYAGNRWGWCPGQRLIRPVYAPALVAFVGGSGFSVSISLGGGGPVGWFPLGPRDIYVPPYRASRNYFNNVNVTNIRNVYVNKTVINNYYGNYAAQRPMNEARYAYRNDPHAFTAVPRNVFTGAKPVRNAVLHVPSRSIAQAQVMSAPRITPTKASLAVRPPARPIAMPARAFDRTVVARHAPPPRPVPFATRERVIAKQGGAPIPMAQLQQMRQQQTQSQKRVQVVAAKPKTAGTLPPMKRVQNLTPSASRASIAEAPVHAAATQNVSKPTPLRPGELPSARFAHPQRNVNPAARSASEREVPSRSQQAQQQQTQMHNQQAQQNAEQARVQQQQVQQREAQSRQQVEQGHVQQQQAQQRGEQARAQQQAQPRQAQMEQQRDEQARAQQQAQQRQAQMEQQRDEQARAQQQAQQREAQARQRDEQVRTQQAQMQQQRAEQARQAQMMQQQREAQQPVQQQQMQQMQHAPHPQHTQQPPQPQHAPPPKKKDHDDQDNGH